MMILLNFLENLLSIEVKDILFAYRTGLQVGILDAQNIEKYLKKNRENEVYVFTEKEINQSVKEYFAQLENTQLIKCKNVRKEIKNWEEKEEFKDKKIKKVSLDSFGSRPLQRDPD